MESSPSLQHLGLKQTKSRKLILSLLQQSKKPLSVQEILKSIFARDEHVDQVTIYRILDMFVQKGIASRLEFQEGKFRYELVGTDHHHLICDSCERIEDIDECITDDLQHAIMRKKGFVVKRHSLEFFGICSSCLK